MVTSLYWRFVYLGITLVACSGRNTGVSMPAPAKEMPARVSLGPNYYDVTGDAALRLWLSMHERGPVVKGRRVLGETSVRQRWAAEYELDSQGRCTIADVYVQTRIKYVGPYWAGSLLATEGTIAWWDDLEAFIWKNEWQYGKTVRDKGRMIREYLMGLEPMKDCHLMRKRALMIARNIGRSHKLYDVIIEHFTAIELSTHDPLRPWFDPCSLLPPSPYIQCKKPSERSVGPPEAGSFSGPS